ncbi:unnamed protein product, partial [Prorocentrum cordatum]
PTTMETQSDEIISISHVALPHAIVSFSTEMQTTAAAPPGLDLPGHGHVGGDSCAPGASTSWSRPRLSGQAARPAASSSAADVACLSMLQRDALVDSLARIEQNALGMVAALAGAALPRTTSQAEAREKGPLRSPLELPHPASDRYTGPWSACLGPGEGTGRAGFMRALFERHVKARGDVHLAYGLATVAGQLQAPLDQGRWSMARLLTHLPEPPRCSFGQVPAHDALRPLGRLSCPSWTAAAMAFVKGAAALSESRLGIAGDDREPRQHRLDEWCSSLPACLLQLRLALGARLASAGAAKHRGSFVATTTAQRWIGVASPAPAPSSVRLRILGNLTSGQALSCEQTWTVAEQIRKGELSRRPPISTGGRGTAKLHAVADCAAGTLRAQPGDELLAPAKLFGGDSIADGAGLTLASWRVRERTVLFALIAEPMLDQYRQKLRAASPPCPSRKAVKQIASASLNACSSACCWSRLRTLESFHPSPPRAELKAENAQLRKEAQGAQLLRREEQARLQAENAQLRAEKAEKKKKKGCPDCAPVVHCDCPPVEPTSFKEVIHERTPALEQAGLLAGVLATGVLIGVQLERLAPGTGAGRCARRRPAAHAGWLAGDAAARRAHARGRGARPRGVGQGSVGSRACPTGCSCSVMAAAAAGGHPLGLVEGEFFAMRYNVGGPELWHVRCCVGTPLTYLVGLGVMTPDLDEYEEELLRGGDVLDWVRLPGPDSIVAQAGPHAAYHRFRVLPTVAELTLARVQCHRRMGLEPPAGVVHPLVGGAPVAGAPAGGDAAAAAPPAMLRQPLHLRPPPCSRPAPLEGSPPRAGVSPPLEGASLASPLPSVLRPGPLSLPLRPRGQEALSRRPPRRRLELLHARPLRLPRPSVLMATLGLVLCCTMPLAVVFGLLETLACYDQLNLPNVASAELAARELQVAEGRHRGKIAGGSDDRFDTHLARGTDLVRGNLCIMPAFTEWIASELSKEYSAMKERRKAREERVLARPKKGPEGNREQEQGRCFPGQRRLRAASLHELKSTAQRRLPSVLLGIGTSFRSLLLALALTPALRHLSHDGLPAVSLQRASDTAGAGYVDNFMILGSDRAAVTNGSTVPVKAKNLWRLRCGIEAVLRRGVCSGSALQVIMGHITWIALLRREPDTSGGAHDSRHGAEGRSREAGADEGSTNGQRAPSATRQAKQRQACGNLSLLERLAVKPGTERLYLGAAAAFASFCQSIGADWSSPQELDTLLVSHFSAEFLEGSSVEEASKLLASLSHFLPELDKATAEKLPRATRCLVAWRRRVPPRMRPPLSRAAALALAGCLRHLGHPRMCIWVALAFIAYLRPLETFQLRGSHLVAPKIAAGRQCSSRGLPLHDASVGDPSKTGMFDAAVLLDRCDWLLPSLEALKAQSHPGGSLWDISPAELQRLFASLVQILGLDPLSPHLYSLRRGGASDDLVTGSRCQEEVKVRGQWATLASLKRYGKTTRLLLEMAKVPEDVFVLGRAVEANFSNVMSEGFGFAGPLSAVRLPSRLAAALGPGSAIRRGLPTISPRAKSAGIYGAASGPALFRKSVP